MVLEITGAEDKIEGLLEVLRPIGILEMVRTGRVAMARGSKSTGEQAAAAVVGSVEPSEDISYSV
jgi:hypothetical protein